MKGVPLRGRGDPLLYLFIRTLANVLIGLPFRLQAIGGGNLPGTGAAIIAVTHKSTLDPIFAGVSFARPLRYMAKKELFAVLGLGRLIGGLGAFPVDRGAGDRAALETALRVLAEGEVLLMFPEGHRHKDEVIHPFFPGVGMLAVRAGAPVIPVAIQGTHTLGDKWPPRLSAVTAKIGPPVDLSGLEGRCSRVYAAATERIEAAVRDLYETS